MKTSKEQLLAEWEAVLKSSGWEMYQRRLLKMLDTASANLEKNSDYARLLQSQGEVAAIRQALRLPEDIRKDLLRNQGN